MTRTLTPLIGELIDGFAGDIHGLGFEILRHVGYSDDCASVLLWFFLVGHSGF